MVSRRGGRKICLDCLYLWDNCKYNPSEAWKSSTLSIKNSPQGLTFAKSLFDGIVSQQEHIDRLIEGSSHHWKLERMSSVDRNILRLAIYEILFMLETPINVIINEALEIAKNYSTDDSSKFVNGILDNDVLLLER